jgi:hypothetical protein
VHSIKPNETVHCLGEGAMVEGVLDIQLVSRPALRERAKVWCRWCKNAQVQESGDTAGRPLVVGRSMEVHNQCCAWHGSGCLGHAKHD